MRSTSSSFSALGQQISLRSRFSGRTRLRRGSNMPRRLCAFLQSTRIGSSRVWSRCESTEYLPSEGESGHRSRKLYAPPPQKLFSSAPESLSFAGNLFPFAPKPFSCEGKLLWSAPKLFSFAPKQFPSAPRSFSFEGKFLSFAPKSFPRTPSGSEPAPWLRPSMPNVRAVTPGRKLPHT